MIRVTRKMAGPSIGTEAWTDVAQVTMGGEKHISFLAVLIPPEWCH